MVRALLLDMGGTLDGDGLHWLDRFAALYRAAGVDLPRERVRSAFDEAERRAAVDDEMATAGLETMVDRHVAWQLEHLAVTRAGLREELVNGFVGPVRRAAADNRPILARLTSRGLKLGIV